MTNLLKKAAGGVTFEVWHHENPTAVRLNNLATHDLFKLPIPSLGQEIGPDRPDDLEGGWLREDRHIVDRLQGRQEASPLSGRYQRSAVAFESPDPGIGIDRHDQAIGFTLDPFQVIQVS